MKQKKRTRATVPPTPPKRTLTYAPDVEANRTSYERLAEAWIIVADTEASADGSTATVDLGSNRAGAQAPVINAFHQHFRDLIFDYLEWFLVGEFHSWR